MCQDHAHERHGTVGAGPCVLDVGDDVGALVALLDPSWLGHELHACTADGTATTHTGVWERHLASGPVAAAVFVELHEGTWALLGSEGGELARVEVVGGRVTETDLRAASRRG